MQLKLTHLNNLITDTDHSLLQQHGDDISNDPKSSTTRIAFQNIRGIDREPEPAVELIQTIQDFQIDIFGAAETNCDWTQEFNHRVGAILQKTFGNTLLTTSSANHPNKNGYLPGGVCQIARGSIVGRMPKHGQDNLGRYAWQKYTGSNERKLCIITAYRVSQAKHFVSPNSQNNTAHQQQVLGLLKRNILSPDPKQQILDDLSDFIIAEQRNGYEIILMIDANESQHDKPMLTFLQKTGLSDVHSHHHEHGPITTRRGSTQVIDYIFATDGIMDNVTACGHLAYHEGCISDHILTWIDINTKHFFGGSGPRIVRPAAREFQYNNIKLRDSFLGHLHTGFEHQHIEKRILKLSNAFAGEGPTEKHVQEYNRIDRDIVRCIKGASKKTVRKNYGYSRSPALCHAGLQVLYWRMILSCKTSNLPITPKIKQASQRLETIPENDLALPVARIHANVSLKRKELRIAQSNSKQLRMQWLKGVARTKQAEDDLQAAKEINNMIRQMHTAALHQKLTRITKGSREGLDYIEIPTSEWYYSPSLNEIYHYDQGLFECHVATTSDPSKFHTHSSLKVPPSDLHEISPHFQDNLIIPHETSRGPIKWKRITNKTEMEEVIVMRNKKHLQQVAMEEAPPTKPEYSKFFAEYGCSELSDKLLDGELTDELDSFPPTIRTWFQNLSRTEKEKTCPPIDGWITTQEFQEAFRRTKEKTSSSPSGIHYTFWKCMATDDHISSFLSTMMSLPFVYGFVCTRWTRSIDVMLEKSKGVRKIHRLRIIGLVEGDFNTALKLFFAKKLVQNSETTDLTEEQWARPNRTAMDPAIRKMLGFEYSRVMYVTIIFFANDATACFDRMVPDISSIIARKYGMSKNIMRCRNSVLSLLKRGVRTLHGDSEITYSQMAMDLAILGEYQGKADAAPIWSIESHTFLKTHKMLIDGAFMPHVIDKTLAICKNNDAYVDDDDMTITQPGSDFNSISLKLTSKAEESAQLWNDILFLSGAGVAHHKSMWQGIAFDNSTCPPTIQETFPGTIQLRDRKGVPTQIKQLPASHPNKGLGCHLAPTAALTGTEKHEFDVRENQISTLAANIRPANLSIIEAHSMMEGRIMTSVGYPAAITQFSTQQNRRLNTIIDEELLPQASYNRHTPKMVIYSPLSLGGAAWPSFQLKQDTDSLLTMIKHFRWNGTVGKDMLVVLSAWQLASGLCTPIMENTTTPLPYLGKGWFTHVRNRLSTIKGKLWIERQWTPSLQRLHDRAIMEIFLSDSKLTKKQLEIINYVRLYLRVITLSEISNDKGTIIQGDRFTGKWRANSSLHWPDVPRPPPSAFSLFRAKLKSLVGTSSSGSRKHNAIFLQQPLGTWLDAPRHIRHMAYRTDTTVYRRTSLNAFHFDCYSKTKSNLFDFQYPTRTLPSKSIPVTIGIRDDTVWTNDEYSLLPTVSRNNGPVEFRRPSTESPLAGSDGSVDIITGASAAAYTVFTGTEEIAGNERLPDSAYANSYRAELHGELLTTNCIANNVTTPITQICDNQKAVDVITKPITNPSRMLDPEMDLILAIKHSRNRTKIPSDPEWVKGHTDRNKKPHERTAKERLNIKVDHISGDARKHATPKTRTPYPGSGAMLIINDKWITTSYREQIHRAFMEPGHRKFFCSKFHLDNDIYDTIAWRYIGYARKNLHRELNARIAKYMYNWLNSGRQKGLMEHDPTCPCCGAPEETQLHMFQCNNPTVSKTRTSSIASFRKHLTESKIPAPITNLIHDIVQHTINSSPLPQLPPSTPQVLHTAYTQQRRIGMELMTRGFLATGWIKAIRYYTHDKTDQKVKAILLGLWHNILEPIWEVRNNILHKTNNIVTTNEHNQLDSELMDWKNLAHVRLHHTQSHLVTYSRSDFTYWTLQHKRNTLHILQLAHRNYKQYLDSDNSNIQTLITQYFIPLSHG